MKFPKCLETNGRTQFPDYKIHNKNYMYSRHKPGIDWNKGDDFPDFTKIKIDQSLNWSAFSIPVWVRFNNEKEFKMDYGVIGILVRSIRRTNEIDRAFSNFTWIVIHDPDSHNYAHCELKLLKKLSKPERRFLRMSLTHKAVKYLFPEEPYQKNTLFIDIIIMLYHRILVKFFCFGGSFFPFNLTR